MSAKFNIASIFVMIVAGTLLTHVDSCIGQTYAIAPAPTSFVTVHRRTYYSYPAVVPVQATYTSYYAPQVPVVPMAVSPVPVVSAYYVPSATVTHHYVAPVVPVRRFRRYAVPVAPVVVHPVYAYGY